MRFFALFLGKILFFLLKILGKTGGALPGKVAIGYCPNLLSYFKYPDITILVTGTNGKTSTSNLLASIFKKAGYDVISNSRGDNIINGISSLLIKHSGFDFKIKAQVAVLEVDELTLAKNLKDIKASDIVVTNFFRDQLDRAGEVETIITKIENALKEYKNRLFLNEDDPNVKRLAWVNKDFTVFTYGLEKTDRVSKEHGEAKDAKFCPLCKSDLVYDYYQYSHLGQYRCTSCSFASGQADYLAREIDIQENSFMVEGEKYGFSIHATYHMYNLMAALSIAKYYQIESHVIDIVFRTFHLGIGRMETIEVGEKKVLLNLVKNPTGCNEIIKYIEQDQKEKTLIFLLNDNYADGRDISWIWDVNFEQIQALKTIITTGSRAYEAGLRFKLSSICEEIVVEKDIDRALDIFLQADTSLYIISTYTGLFEIRKKLLKKA